MFVVSFQSCNHVAYYVHFKKNSINFDQNNVSNKLKGNNHKKPQNKPIATHLLCDIKNSKLYPLRYIYPKLFLVSQKIPNLYLCDTFILHQVSVIKTMLVLFHLEHCVHARKFLMVHIDSTLIKGKCVMQVYILCFLCQRKIFG